MATAREAGRALGYFLGDNTRIGNVWEYPPPPLWGLQQHTSVPKWPLFCSLVMWGSSPQEVSWISSFAWEHYSCSANYFIWDHVTKIDSLRKVLYLFQKVVHYVKHFLDREEICCGWLRFYFFPQVFQQFKMTLLKLEMLQRNSFWVRNKLLRWTLVVQLIFSPQEKYFFSLLVSTKYSHY